MIDFILRGMDKLNQKSAWTLFLDWFCVAYCQEVSEETKWFLGFTNCIVDLRDLSTRNHEKSLCCLHGIPVIYKATPPSIKTMDFLLDLSGRYFIKTNLFRSFLYIVFTNKTDLEIAPYFYGAAGMGKSTLLEFIQKISYGNCVSMDLNTWSSNFGKSVAIGASIILFDDINYHGLTYLK